MSLCPCSSGKSFETCCQPILRGHSPPTALALMRSRYTAYTQGEAQYLLDTTHSKTRSNHRLEDIGSWSSENTWKKLEVISAEHGNRSDERGIVEFKAYFIDKHGKSQVHHERSTFLKQDQRWFYLDGKFNPKPVNFTKKVSRNDPCPCGSGKKHKKCCG